MLDPRVVSVGRQPFWSRQHTARDDQRQAVVGIAKNVRQSFADAYDSNGLAGAVAMGVTSVGGSVAEGAVTDGAGTAAKIGLKGAAEAAKVGALAEKVGHDAAGVGKIARAAEKVEEGVAVAGRKRMKKFRVGCFRAGKKTRGKLGEYDRQLRGQQEGLNRMTVQEYLDGRKAFGNKGRAGTGAAQQIAREDYAKKLRETLIDQLNDKGIVGQDADRLADKEVKDRMSTLDALHNPDMIAGGKDVVVDMGDRGVNRSIGGQWPQREKRSDELVRVKALDEAAHAVPKAEQATTLMNVNLERCPLR